MSLTLDDWIEEELLLREESLAYDTEVPMEFEFELESQRQVESTVLPPHDHEQMKESMIPSAEKEIEVGEYYSSSFPLRETSNNPLVDLVQGKAMVYPVS